jgi:hypothetical protein
MAEAASRQNKRAESRSPSRHGHLCSTGELLAWFPLGSVDLVRVGSPGAIVFRRGRGVSGVCSGVGGLLMLLSSPRPAVVAREWKRMAPSPSSLGLFVVFF